MSWDATEEDIVITFGWSWGLIRLSQPQSQQEARVWPPSSLPSAPGVPIVSHILEGICDG